VSIEIALLLALAAAPTVDDVRMETRALLESLCGWQCDVAEVAIKTKPATPSGGVVPGFDDAPAARQVPSAIELTILFDSKLSPTFRSFVTERVRSRIGERGLPVTIAPKLMPFPERPMPPSEEERPPKEAPQQQQQPPAPIIVQAPAAPAPLPVAERPNAMEALVLRLIESLPLLLLALLLAWTVMRVLKRYESFLGPPITEEEHRPKQEESPAKPPERTLAPPPNVDQLRADLEKSRGATRRVFRTLVLSEEHDVVAHAAAIFGEVVLADLAHDPEVRSTLSSLGRRAAEILREPIDEETRASVLRRIRAELVADRLAHPREEVRRELEVLFDLGPEAFAALATRLPARLRVLLLRYAPQHLVEAYLRGLAAKEQNEAARSLLGSPPADPSEIGLLVEAIESERPAALLSGEEADRIVDLLDTIPAADQEKLIETLEASRPDFVRRNLGQLPIESALLRIGDHAIARAFAEVPLDEWATYLRAAPETIRGRALHACPARFKEPLKEELGLRITADPTRAIEARRRIVRAALAAQAAATNGPSGRSLATEEREAHSERGPKEMKR
jgi:hypothetical protein